MTTIQTLINEEDVRNFTSYVDGMGRRASRDQLLPILKKHFEPVVAAERQFLSGHSRSGALMTSLVARTGAGDKPGTMSVFSAPTATTKQLQKTSFLVWIGPGFGLIYLIMTRKLLPFKTNMDCEWILRRKFGSFPLGNNNE